MAYAVRDDVLARAGRFAGVFSVDGRRPNEADLDAFLDDVTDAIDLEIRAKGYDPDTVTDELVGALRDVASWAVLVRALPEATLGDEGAQELVDRGIQILEAAGFPGLAKGGTADLFAGLEALSAGAAGGGAVRSGAGSLWDAVDEWEPEEEDRAAIEPQWRRGQSA